MEKWLSLTTCANRTEAEIVRALLEEHGVQTIIRADDAGGMQPHLANLTGVDVLVRHADFMRARQILEAKPQTDG